MNRHGAKLLLVLALGAVLAALVGGCSTEPENASVRPWNSPQGWESGLPMDLNQQHD
jgi:hypothetical protein